MALPNDDIFVESLFWIMALLSDYVLTELRASFFKIFFSKIWWIIIEAARAIFTFSMFAAKKRNWLAKVKSACKSGTSLQKWNQFAKVEPVCKSGTGLQKWNRFAKVEPACKSGTSLPKWNRLAKMEPACKSGTGLQKWNWLAHPRTPIFFFNMY